MAANVILASESLDTQLRVVAKRTPSKRVLISEYDASNGVRETVLVSEQFIKDIYLALMAMAVEPPREDPGQLELFATNSDLKIIGVIGTKDNKAE